MLGCWECAQLTGGDCGKHGTGITVTSGVTLSTAPPPRQTCQQCGAPLLNAGEKHAIVLPPRTRPPFYFEVEE